MYIAERSAELGHGAAGGRTKALLRLCRLQFALLPAGSIAAGFLAGGGENPFLLTVFTLATVVAHAASALFNAYSDFEEDRLNIPEYAALVEQVGRRFCLELALVCLFVITALAVAGWFLFPLPSILQTLIGLAIATYSVGPRFKGSALASLVLMWLHVGWPFLLGALLGGEGGLSAATATAAAAMALVLGVFYALSRTIRHVHDVEGDEAAGVANFFSRFTRSSAWPKLAALFLVPYLVLSLTIVAGWLPARLLVVLLLAPAALRLAVLLPRTHTAEQHSALFDWSTLYTALAHFSLLALFLPRPEVLVGAAGAIALKIFIAHGGLDYRTHLTVSSLLSVRFPRLGRA